MRLMAASVLIVEDDTSLAHLITHEMERLGMTASCTDSSVDAIMLIQRERYDAVLLDIMLSGTSGLYVVDAVRDIAAPARPKILVMTGAKSTFLTNLDRSLVRAVVFKPLDVQALAAYVKALTATSGDDID
jgi:DNA-binding response OmpR family regulator